MKISQSLRVACLIAGLCIYSTTSYAIDDTPLLHSFIHKMVTQHYFKEAQLKALFKSAKLRNDILKVISKPAETHTPWYRYQQQFITEAHITTGVQFWLENQKDLADIAQKYGVPAQVIVAIIGVETFYGKESGRYRVIDVLSTLGFFYQKRSPFFLTELENFLLLCREEHLNPLMPLGSYAGAMGLGQFMPSSVRTYAVDYNQDEHRDIWHNRAEVIASVANYLAKYGWIREQAIAYPVTAQGDKYQQALLSKDLRPDFSLAQLQNLNIVLPTKSDLTLKAKLFRFEQEQTASLWLGLNNFYVITRYNHSAFYAMAVYQLSAAILTKKETHL